MTRKLISSRLRGKLTAAIALCGVATSTFAQAPLTGAEFEAYTKDRTLFFRSGGQPYGAERYMSGRRVEWSFLDGECQSGVWYESGPMICFVYETNPDAPQCWTFFREGGGLKGLFEGADGGTVLYEALEMDEELLCLGPQIGV